RRTFLKGAAVAVGASTLTGPAFSAALAVEPGAVFQYGVASGDPLPDRVMIWTRVTPTPDATPGSGKGAATAVRWSVRDGAGKVVRTGTASTSALSDHTLKIDVDGLRPDTAYTYAFTAKGKSSPVGATRTAPAANAANRRLRFGMVSCSNYTGGFFSAYRHLAARDDLDFVVHLGDYLYEYGNGGDRYGPASLAGVRDHDPATEMLSLADYRRRHAQYKADKDLSALHRRHAFITTWDDHEVADNTWREGANNHQEATEGPYLARRNRSYQVYDEWMPIRLPQRRSAQETRIYRRLRFGTLADLTMLDLRQYRDIQEPNTDGAAIDAPDRTMTGTQQQAFLEQGLTAKGSPTWRLFGNSVQIMPIKSPPLPNAAAAGVAVLQGTPTPVSLPGSGFSLLVDAWDGYTANRRRVLEVAQSSVGDPVFLTGDIHSTWAADLPLDPGTYTGSPTAASPSAGVEFVCTSVTADNLDQITGSPPRTTSIPVEDAILAANRHIKELEFDSHGYSVVDITPERVQFDSFFLSNREDPAATSTFYRGYQSLRGSRTTTRATTQVPPTRDDRPSRPLNRLRRTAVTD
ncbi:MAG: alkaline phosphatase D family protein, partial [Frankiales bacterium]|nr:alkaline phosphatase D family protein [Frankiales bacterium]